MKYIVGILFCGLILNAANYFMKPEEPTTHQIPILSVKIVELERQKSELLKEVRVLSIENAEELRKIKQNNK